MKIQLSEKQRTGQVVDFMELNGWRSVRNQTGMMVMGPGRAVPFGEPGMPDWLFVRYKALGYGLIVWVEMKAENALLSCRCKPEKKRLCTAHAQRKWKQEEIARGGLIVTIGRRQIEAFTAAGEILLPSPEKFIEWYGKAFGHLGTADIRGQLPLITVPTEGESEK